MTTYIEKISEPLQQWYQSSSINAFFTWWSAELKDMVPQKYRSSLFPKSAVVYITPSEGEEDAVNIWQVSGDELVELTFDDSVQGKEWWHKLNHHLGTTEIDTEVTYLLNESSVLVRNVAMPLAAINDIDSVLGFELDKYVPFDPNDVVFAYNKGEVVEGSEKFPVMLTAMKKNMLNDLIEAVESKGLQLSGIDVNVGSADQPQRLGVNLLPKSVRKKKDWTKIKWNLGLSLLALLLLGFVMYSSLENKRIKINSLETQVSALKKDARRAKLLETELNESIQAANFLGNLKKDTPSRLKMFSELTSKVPMDTYLTRVMINHERLEVVGESDNANALVPILNQSETWYEPQIIGNVTQNARSGKEKFTIKSELKPLNEEADSES